MLRWALIFLVISLVAGALGFTGVARGAATLAKILFGIFLLIFVAPGARPPGGRGHLLRSSERTDLPKREAGRTTGLPSRCLTRSPGSSA